MPVQANGGFVFDFSGSRNRPQTSEMYFPVSETEEVAGLEYDYIFWLLCSDYVEGFFHVSCQDAVLLKQFAWFLRGDFIEIFNFPLWRFVLWNSSWQERIITHGALNCQSWGKLKRVTLLCSCEKEIVAVSLGFNLTICSPKFSKIQTKFRVSWTHMWTTQSNFRMVWEWKHENLLLWKHKR